MSRINIIKLFLDTVFQNRAISVEKSEPDCLNDKDNRFSKCSFSKAYYELYITILRIIFYAPNPRIKKRNSVRYGEYVMLDKERLMSQTGYFIYTLYGINIIWYYRHIFQNKEEVNINDVLFHVMKEIIGKELFNKGENDNKDNGYGEFELKTTEFILEDYLIGIFKDEKILFKMRHILIVSHMPYLVENKIYSLVEAENRKVEPLYSDSVDYEQEAETYIEIVQGWDMINFDDKLSELELMIEPLCENASGEAIIKCFLMTKKMKIDNPYYRKQYDNIYRILIVLERKIIKDYLGLYRIIKGRLNVRINMNIS